MTPLEIEPTTFCLVAQCFNRVTMCLLVAQVHSISITRISIRDKEGHISQMVESLDQPPEFFVFASILP